jgi:ubiquinone/menaquinone biosynthesis C-methylase UbiE
MKELIHHKNGHTDEIELDQEGPTEAMRMDRHLEYLLKLKPPYKMLAVGCGKGFIVDYFREKGVDAYGIDIRNVFPKNKPYFILGDARKMPFQGNVFDVVSECLMFTYLINIKREEPKAQEDTNKILMEMHRVLKPGGYLYSEYGPIPNEDYLLSLGYKNLCYKNYPVSLVYQKPK